MTNPYSVEQGEKLLTLLKEYTEKLRYVCEKHNHERNKSRYIRQIYVIFAIFVPITFWIFLKKFFDQTEYSLAIISFSTLAVIVAVFSVISTINEKKLYSYDAYVVARVLERLVKNASVQFENSKSIIYDQFEYDIRLAEAEAAIRMYRDVFSQISESGNIFAAQIESSENLIHKIINKKDMK